MVFFEAKWSQGNLTHLALELSLLSILVFEALDIVFEISFQILPIKTKQYWGRPIGYYFYFHRTMCNRYAPTINGIGWFPLQYFITPTSLLESIGSVEPFLYHMIAFEISLVQQLCHFEDYYPTDNTAVCSAIQKRPPASVCIITATAVILAYCPWTC